MNKTIGIVLAVFVLGAGAFWLMGRSAAPVAQKMPAVGATGIPADVTEMFVDASGPSGAEGMTAPKTVNVTVTGNSFSFEPKEIRVTRGDTVEVVFKNDEGFHDFVIDEVNAKTKQISAGTSETVTFTADTAGTFEYYCSVGEHRANGMVGKLIVE